MGYIKKFLGRIARALDVLFFKFFFSCQTFPKMPQKIDTLIAKNLPLLHQESTAFWLDVFKKLCAQNKMSWIKPLNNSKVVFDTEVAYKYKIQELTLALSMCNLESSLIKYQHRVYPR